MTTVVPPNAMSKIDNLVSALCTKEEISDPERVQVNVGTEVYYCDAESAGFAAGAASTAIAENIHGASKKKLAVEEEWGWASPVYEWGKDAAGNVVQFCLRHC